MVKSPWIGVVVVLQWLCLITIAWGSDEPQHPSQAEPSPPLRHPAKIYTNSKGEIFLPQKLPLYLFISSSPDGSGDVVPLSNYASQHQNQPVPLYFEGPGRHTIVHPYDGHQENVKATIPFHSTHTDDPASLFQINVDNDPPKTTWKMASVPMKEQSKRLIVGKPLEVEFVSEDDRAGVEKTLFSINGQPFETFDATLKLDQEGDFDLRYYSVDHVGNTEEVQSKAIAIDLQAPTTAYSVEGPQWEGVLSPKTALTLRSQDNRSGVAAIFFQFDPANTAAKEAKYTKPLILEHLSDGLHQLQYHAIDEVANLEKERLFDFYLDKTPPQVTLSVEGDEAEFQGRRFVSVRSRIVLKAEDNKSGVSGVRYRWPSKTHWETFKEPFLLSAIEGGVDLEFEAEDRVGNRSKVWKQTLIVDLTPPKTTVIFEGPSAQNGGRLFLSPKTGVQLVATDSGSGVQTMMAELKGQSPHRYQSPITIAEEGDYTLAFWAIDRVNNPENSQDLSFIVDATPPAIHLIPSVNALRTITDPATKQEVSVYPENLTLFIAAADLLSGVSEVAVQNNNEPEQAYHQPLSFTKAGRYEIVVIARDKVANLSQKRMVFQVQ